MHEQYLNYFAFEKSDSPHCIIRLAQPPYQNLVLVIGRRLDVIEQEGQRTAVQFDYEILEQPPNFDENLLNADFDNLLGGIVLALLERNFKQDDNDKESDQTGDETGLA